MELLLNFTVLDRLTLNALMPQMIPAMASRALYKQIDLLARELSFTSEEISAYSIVFANNEVRWDDKKAGAKEVGIAPELVGVIWTGLKGLDEAKRLPKEAIGLYDLFEEASRAATHDDNG